MVPRTTFGDAVGSALEQISKKALATGAKEFYQQQENKRLFNQQKNQKKKKKK